jgi:uncharacterized protein (TIGR02300 family)
VSPQSLGTKRACPSCNARFYDLDKNPAKCPKCGHSFDPAVLVKARKSRTEKKVVEIRAPERPTPAEKEKAKKKIEGLPEIEAFGDIEPMEGEEQIEELEEMDDMEVIEESVETPANEKLDDDISLEEGVEGAALIDTVEGSEEEESESDSEEEGGRQKKNQKRRKAK